MSNRTPWVFTTEFKERAVLRLDAGEQFSALAADLGVRRKLLYDWCKAYRQRQAVRRGRQLSSFRNSVYCRGGSDMFASI